MYTYLHTHINTPSSPFLNGHLQMNLDWPTPSVFCFHVFKKRIFDCHPARSVKANTAQILQYINAHVLGTVSAQPSPVARIVSRDFSTHQFHDHFPALSALPSCTVDPGAISLLRFLRITHMTSSFLRPLTDLEGTMLLLVNAVTLVMAVQQ